MAKYYPDVSHYHPIKDWNAVKLNCPFLISKATQGTSYIDTTLGQFIAGCENHKIPYWLYVYYNKGNELEQAKYLVRVLSQRINKNSKYFMGYIHDVEAGNNPANVAQAMRYLSQQGKKTILYTMYAEYGRYKDIIADRGNNCAWWEARYGQNNGYYNPAYPCHAGADLHQYTSRGTVPGIGNSIDLNRMVNKTESWFTRGAAAGSPDPVPTASTLALAYQVMLGQFGSGQERMAALGSRYDEVQAFINHIARANARTLAEEVIAGKYGTGEVRKVVLGDKYRAVQTLVNKMI